MLLFLSTCLVSLCCVHIRLCTNFTVVGDVRSIQISVSNLKCFSLGKHRRCWPCGVNLDSIKILHETFYSCNAILFIWNSKDCCFICNMMAIWKRHRAKRFENIKRQTSSARCPKVDRISEFSSSTFLLKSHIIMRIKMCKMNYRQRI